MKQPTILARCKKLLPDVSFVESHTFYWSPANHTIYVNFEALGTDEGMWALIHEVAHGTLAHMTYKNDQGLLKLEVEAWEAAHNIAHDLGAAIDMEHVQDCLDTYRNWLYARSTCPTCTLNSLQIDATQYQCLNCSTKWTVSASRFCRPYRMKLRHQKTSPESLQTTFS